MAVLMHPLPSCQRASDCAKIAVRADKHMEVTELVRQPAAVSSQSARMHMQIHPRALAALGAQLVTDDNVAIMELVKNGYDAGAGQVLVRLGHDETNAPFLEIVDDGCGMGSDEIRSIWGNIATPHKRDNPYLHSNGIRRRVSGEKGLGRLAAARLGKRMVMFTKKAGEQCLRVEMDWEKMADATSFEQMDFSCTSCPDHRMVKSASGTTIRVFDLTSAWDDDKLAGLEAELSRFAPPFAQLDDFVIQLQDSDDAQKKTIKANVVLEKPTYRIAGTVDSAGNVEASYQFVPIGHGKPRSEKLAHPWEELLLKTAAGRKSASQGEFICGPFEFEIRAWELNIEDIGALSENLNLKRRQIRKAIKSYNGISVYRDGVLVLPKSDKGRDWLGLDARKVVKYVRLGTNQVVGHVSIGAQTNPGLQDTSNREKLVDGPEASQFREIIIGIVAMLERQRNRDWRRPSREKTFAEMFREIDASTLVTKIKIQQEQGAASEDIVKSVENYAEKSRKTGKDIQERVVYYSRLAAVGTIAQTIIHEIRNCTSVLGSFVRFCKDKVDQAVKIYGQAFADRIGFADASTERLDQLSDNFMPLARRGWREVEKGSCIFEQQVRSCLQMMHIKGKIAVVMNEDDATEIAMDAGEVDTILLNLMSNSAYWLAQVPAEHRQITISTDLAASPGRVQIEFADTGPGIDGGDVARIFLPGVTSRPGGMGMGLTVIAELVAAAGGKLGVHDRQGGQGAAFVFDLPLKNKVNKRESENTYN